MALTEAQRTVLAAHIRANTDPEVQAALAIRNDNGLMQLYNADAVPDFWIWRNAVTREDVQHNGFDWTLVDNLSVGKDRIWTWLFDNPERVADPSDADVRAGIAECWKGTAAMLDQRLRIFEHCQRKASVAEKIFATGTGTSTDVNGVGPAFGSVYGPLSVFDVSVALNENP
jgi:hypothetical protein